MRAWLLSSALLLTFSINPAAAQAPSATEGEAHILSAFTSGADPGVLAAGVDVGPALRGQLGGETDSRKIYDALVERTSGKSLRVSLLAPGEVVRYASHPGVKAGEPLIRLEAGELVLLFQYASKQKNVTFVEQLSKPAARTEAAKPEPEAPQPQALPPEAPKPPPIVEVPLPAVPPAPEPPAPVAIPVPIPAPAPAAPAPAPTPPAPVAIPAPIPVPVPAAPAPAPRPPTVAVQKPAPAVRPEKPRPRGECVIKPVMSEEDLWNCSGPVRPAAVDRLAPPVAVQTPPAAVPEPPKARVECVIKPVMSEEDLRNCAAVSTPRTAAVIERPAVVEKPQASVPAIEAPKARPECVIKPVMSDDDLRNCATVSTSRTTAVIERPAVVEKPQASAPVIEAPKARPECVIKPVMSDEDIRNCAAAPRPVALDRPAPPAAVEKPQAPAPAAPQAPRECVIKPVMSEEDLRACGVRR